MLLIPVRPATSLFGRFNDAAVAVVNDAKFTVISVAVVVAFFNDTEVANVAAVAVISLVALVNDAALEVVNVCCTVKVVNNDAVAVISVDVVAVVNDAEVANVAVVAGISL